MTGIGHYQAPLRRSGLLGIHSIGEFVLSVPAVEKAEHFYGHFGLDARAEGDVMSLHTKGNDYRWGRIVHGPRKEMHYISFHCFKEDLPRFRQHIEAAGVKLLDPPPGFDSNGLWLRDQDDMLIEIRVGVETSPDEKVPAQCDA